jgi:hypothetical protein
MNSILYSVVMLLSDVRAITRYELGHHVAFVRSVKVLRLLHSVY